MNSYNRPRREVIDEDVHEHTSSEHNTSHQTADWTPLIWMIAFIAILIFLAYWFLPRLGLFTRTQTPVIPEHIDINVNQP